MGVVGGLWWWVVGGPDIVWGLFGVGSDQSCSGNMGLMSQVGIEIDSKILYVLWRWRLWGWWGLWDLWSGLLEVDKGRRGFGMRIFF